MNADEHRSLGGQYGVQGFPTIKVFGRDKKKPEDFRGNRNAQVCYYFLSLEQIRLDVKNVLTHSDRVSSTLEWLPHRNW